MATIQEKRASHEKLMREIQPLTAKMESGELNETEGKELDSKAAEALTLQKDLEQHERLIKMQERGRDLGRIPLPGARSEEKGEQDDGNASAGLMSLGEQFVRSEKFQEFRAHGTPRIDIPIVSAREHRKGFAPVSNGDVKAMREVKSVPSLGTGVIDPQRLSEIALTTQFDALELMSVLNVSNTDSDTIEWIRYTHTRAAAAVATSASKPEAAASAALENTPVRTFAVQIPVPEQTLADAPRIISMINTHLLYDLEKLKEEQACYGSGSGQNFTGFFNDTDVLTARTVSGDKLADKIRRGITDVRRSGFRPNAIVVDPLDGEELALQKGSDGHYLYVSFPTQDGGNRLWALRVVESVSMEETALASNPERNVLVGDFARGATWWNREAVALAMGWINDQFIKNQRTIRAEFRAAFTVQYPAAFRKVKTHTASGAS